ncbi:MAG: hypothetical protein PHT25_11465 [Bacteroidales bacterium]|nr:hypothetical protein [Bacteroidales bacterium]
MEGKSNMENTKVIVNELNFSHLLELGKIAVEKGGIPKEIIEKMLERIACENELSPQFLC